MTEPVDLGARCPRHRHEVFPVRCPACQSLANEYESLHITPETIDAP